MSAPKPTTPFEERTHKLACRIYSQVRKKTGNVSITRAQAKNLHSSMILSESLLSGIYTGEQRTLGRLQAVRQVLEEKRAMFTQWQYEQMTALLNTMEKAVSGSVSIEQLFTLTSAREVLESEYKDQIGKAIK